MSMTRCGWVNLQDPLYTRYHDEEWGVPLRGEQALFERLCLEGAQAGLSWLTILRKRDHYRRVFDGFDPARVARYDDVKVAALLQDPGIVRNRAKIAAAIHNARAVLALQEEMGSFSDYLWSFVDGAPRLNRWRSHREVPALTPDSQRMSRELLRRGFKFVGPTICYALMQATGMVNDHTTDCYRWGELTAEMQRTLRPEGDLQD